MDWEKVIVALEKGAEVADDERRRRVMLNSLGGTEGLLAANWVLDNLARALREGLGK